MTEQFKERFRAARRAYIAKQYASMNPRQLEAVLTTQGPVLLLAGAGSGKTTVLINRIANLIRFGSGADSPELPEGVTEEDVLFLEAQAALDRPTEPGRADALAAYEPAAPWSIIAITFTNKAANELKDRLTRMIGGTVGEDVWAMTFHSACCRILRREIELLGYSSSFTIYDTTDSERVIKEILKEFNLDDKIFVPRKVLGAISKAKDKQQGAAEFRKDVGDDYRLRRIADIYEEYAKRLKASNAVDFDDIILLTVQLLQNFEDVRDYYQRKFRYVLIDEYQDTNHLQYLLASLLAGRYENICVVGDDDQSIYRFRGATIRNILDFENEYHGAKVIRLEQNYRSTQSILDAANAVIKHNTGRKGKQLWTNNGVGDKILHYEALSEQDEANFVANQILSEAGASGYRDFAILYRTNAQSNALEAAFKPNTDSLAPVSVIGNVNTVPEGMVPESDTANLAVMGYDPRLYSKGRSPLEAASMGIKMRDDETAIRANIVSLAGEGYEKYIKYVCALVCAVMLVSPLCGLDISAVLPGAELSDTGTPGELAVYENRASEYISETVYSEYGIKPLGVNIKIEWVGESPTVTHISLALPEGSGKADAIREYLAAEYGGEVEIIGS